MNLSGHRLSPAVMAIKLDVSCSGLQSTWQSSLQRQCLTLKQLTELVCKLLVPVQDPLRPLLLGCQRRRSSWLFKSLSWWLLPDHCQSSAPEIVDIGHRRSGFLSPALTGSSNKACRESQPEVQEPLLTQNSEFCPSLAVVLSGVFTFHISFYAHFLICTV